VQDLSSREKYSAQWGGYTVNIDATGPAVRAEVRLADDEGVVFMAELPPRTPEQAAVWAATWLEQHGCKAFADGKQHRLVDFLVFVSE
jgi:hypothetical protein